MIVITMIVASNTSDSKLYEELGIDNEESRTVEMRIPKAAVKMYCEAEDGGTDLWLIGDEVSMPLEIPIKEFDKKMKSKN